MDSAPAVDAGGVGLEEISRPAMLCAITGVAMTMAVRKRPDLILMGIGLPGGDGHMVMERLANNVKTAAIPVIFVTARADPASMERAADSGAAGYIVKPYRPEELLGLIRRTLGLDDEEE